ncbi:MAG: putative lipoprotein [Myxococcaceae bacterium]|nr:putative lipoprotein [Myxococcaceae bacterium]
MRVIVTLAVGVLAVSCATAKPETKMSAEEAFGPSVARKLTPAEAKAALGPPKEWAQQFRRDLDCERAAKELEANYGHDMAWSYLKGCITKGGFTQLKTLCVNWEEDLKTRPEAGSLIAQVIGARGGKINTDLQIVQEARIPLFDLASALKQSSAFKGRYLIVIGKVGETKEAKGKFEVVLQEQALQSDISRVMSGPSYGSVSSGSGKASAGWKSTGVHGSGSASGSYSNTRVNESGKMEQRVTDYFDETGQEVIAKMKQPDPFLRSDKNMIFVVRFDGSVVADNENTSEGEQPRRTALVTLISYHDL